MRRFYILIVIFYTMTLCSLAEPIDKLRAAKVAKDFAIEKMNKADTKMTLAWRSNEDGPDASHSNVYAFNLADGKGFVVVSGDDNAETVLGYADEGRFDVENMPPALVETLPPTVAVFSPGSGG